ncbi:nuclear transport factor 2 family protein [Actinomadura rubrisoli]|uniref:Nuclear transport factor 2 family protein n=1 Tax=Actinomadura rubrisoli TaxID=2530368 RepID=A0A4R5BWH5_9ACTN|nr:nuclear transport factor 2 family protein [Actinomadura rubrisoli]TDD91491.1 nuclear transport factor 2 family protein [Actinomadura rubrisoli]
MADEDELIELERAGWRALSTGGAAAADFYGRVLDGEVVMLLPGGMRLTDRAEIVRSMSGPPWAEHRLEEPRVLRPASGTGLVTYGAVARREGSPEYSALVSSLYVLRDDGWKMALHQQTPR